MRCLQRKAKEASAAGQPPPFISSVFSNGELNHPSPSAGDVPGLMHDDCSSSSESDDHLSPSYTPPHADICAISSTQLSTALLSSSMLDTPRQFCWDTVRPESDVYEDDADDSEAQTIRSRRGSREGSGDESEHDLQDVDDEDEFVDSDAEEEAQEGRLGIVGLGKFSRSSLYADDDLLGGF